MTILKETELVIRNEDISGIRLKNCSLAEASFIDCNFRGSILVDGEITSCWLISCCLNELNWKQITNKVLSIFQGHKEHISSLAFNSNRRILDSGSYDKTVKQWNTDDKTMITFKIMNIQNALNFLLLGQFQFLVVGKKILNIQMLTLEKNPYYYLKMGYAQIYQFFLLMDKFWLQLIEI